MATVDIDFDDIDDDKETKHAFFIVFDESFDGISCFVPKSQVEVDRDRKVVTMPEWLATEKELV